MEEARQKLTTLVEDTNTYRRILEGLIAQGLFQMLEDSVVIRCRQMDVALVKVRKHTLQHTCIHKVLTDWKTHAADSFTLTGNCGEGSTVLQNCYQERCEADSRYRKLPCT